MPVPGGDITTSEILKPVEEALPEPTEIEDDSPTEQG